MPATKYRVQVYKTTAEAMERFPGRSPVIAYCIEPPFHERPLVSKGQSVGEALGEMRGLIASSLHLQGLEPWMTSEVEAVLPCVVAPGDEIKR